MEDNLTTQIELDEGFRRSAYQDHLGYLTIGFGRLIDDRRNGGISMQEARLMLENDIARVKAEVLHRLPWAARLDEARQGVLYNMAFQLGVNGLCNFQRMLAYLQTRDYIRAKDEMLDSRWAKQTPERAARLAKQMAFGRWEFNG